MTLPKRDRRCSWLASGLLTSAILVLPTSLASSTPTSVENEARWKGTVNASQLEQQHNQPYPIKQGGSNSIAFTDPSKLMEEGEWNYRKGNYEAALKAFLQALQKFGDDDLNNIAGRAAVLGRVGAAYEALGNYAKALEYQQQYLEIARKLKKGFLSNLLRLASKTDIGAVHEATALMFLGSTYYSLGKYDKAIEYLEQGLPIARDIKGELDDVLDPNPKGAFVQEFSTNISLPFQRKSSQISLRYQAYILAYLGNAYAAQGNYAKAIEYLEQGVKVDRQRRRSGYKVYWADGGRYRDLVDSARLSMNLGSAYVAQGNYAKAIETLEKSLDAARGSKDPRSEGQTLGYLGKVYATQGNYAKAMEYQQQYLAIAQNIKDRAGEGLAFSNMGDLLVTQNQPESAIVFYKQSVNVREGIRADLQPLERELRESYTESVAGTYRRLADLLLSQGRILEAQQVLELLKIQEIQDYTRDTRAVVTQSGGMQYTPVEQKIVNQFGTLVAFGKKVAECEQNKCDQLSQLNQQREALTAQYNQELQQIQKEIRERRANDDAFFDPRNLNTSAQKVVAAQPNTLLIYPLVLNDKLWLLWVAPSGVVNRVEVPVTQTQLGSTVLKFRQLLGDPASNVAQVQATGKQLYQWLIQPLEKELASNQIRTLIFSLDRVTRYIPMAALFDGQRYLVEQFQVSTILSAELTNTSDRLPAVQNTQVLAVGLSDGKAGFNPLPNVPVELHEIVRADAKDTAGVYPGAIFLNQDFTLRSLADNLLGHTIVHIATHGKFVPGLLESSYLLTGTGEQLTIPQINTLSNLGKVHLVVLSACETALGGPNSEGLEIAGLAYYFTTGDRAKAVVSSLWQVNDVSTSQLMQRFYQNLATGKMTKTEALRQAQLSLMQAGSTPTGKTRGDSFKLSVAEEAKPAIASNFSHPYYWAPFILIGNNL